MALRHCVTCGAPFDVPPSSKTINCSKKCASEHRAKFRNGQTVVWSKEARKRLSERGQTPNLQAGTSAAQRSPIAGPFETNQEAKLWWLLNLDSGQRYQVRNLRKFCRDHLELFTPDPWENAYAGLRQVQAWLIGKKVRTVSRWKNWTLERPAEEAERHPDQTA